MENSPELLVKISALMGNMPEWIQVSLTMLGALVVFATAAVRLTPSKKDDLIISKIASSWSKILMFLPTLGINPKTKKMQEALEEVKENIKVKDVPPSS